MSGPLRRIYVAGAGGMLGEAFHARLARVCEARFTDIDVNEPWLSYCDFRDVEQYAADVVRYQPDYLFHVGAHTDLEYCERHPEDAWATNTKSVEHALAIAARLDIPLLFISTAGIFDGRKDTYDEEDEPNPMGVYARTKHAAELLVCENSPRHLVCRAGWMMGGGPSKDKKFVNKLVRQIRNGATVLRVVNDRLGTPTYTHDFVSNVLLLIEHGGAGLYNVVCGGATSRLQVAHELLSCLGLDGRVTIEEVQSSYFQKDYFAPRPRSERLVNRRLQEAGLDVMRDWRVALREYLETYF